MLPVYSFIAIITLLIVVGLFKIVTGAAIECDIYHSSRGSRISIALVLRAFSSGSSSLTGVEAISNAVPFFKKPRAKSAGTLALMATFWFFFVGITFINYWYGIVPKEEVTVLSQIGEKRSLVKIFYIIYYSLRSLKA